MHYVMENRGDFMDINELLALSVKKNASDLHLSPGMPPLFRVDGDLIPSTDIPSINAETLEALIYNTMDEKQREQFHSTHDLDYAIELSGVARFRANAFRQMHGVAAVFRTIPDKTPTLDQLEMPPVFKKLLDLPHGLILLTGPTGSGKSTTLAAMVDYINTSQPCHIITVEDPIEFTHHSKKSLINQRQIHRDTRDFNSALRSALREDPDVILVGEMRDLETIRLALTAAETGHLVLATLHTSTAPRAVSRIVDVFPVGEKEIIRNILSESLQAVIYQALLKKTSGGRIPAFEIMLGTPAIRNLIREDKIAQMYTIIQTGSEAGMCTLDQYLQQLIVKKHITNESAKEIAARKEAF